MKLEQVASPKKNITIFLSSIFPYVSPLCSPRFHKSSLAICRYKSHRSHETTQQQFASLAPQQNLL